MQDLLGCTLQSNVLGQTGATSPELLPVVVHTSLVQGLEVRARQPLGT